MTQKEADTYYLKVAKACSENSKAERLKVGAIIVKNKQMISDGFNGTPSGFDNCCEIEEDGHLVTKDEVLHAESNAIMKCARNGVSCNNATLYITHSPCLHCAKMILQAGIKRVVYINNYRCDDGIKFLVDAGVSISEIKI